MKYVIFLLFLISFVLTEPNGPVIPSEETFSDIKKSILECIIKDVNASTELKNYANQNLNNGLKERLSFSSFRENENDRNIIKQCRRQAFLFGSKDRLKPLHAFPKEYFIPKKINKP